MTVDDLTVGIGKIPYNRDAGPEEVLVFRHYNANEVWIVFSPVYIIRYVYSLRNMPINRHFLGGMIDAYFLCGPWKSLAEVQPFLEFLIQKLTPKLTDQ